MTNTAAPPSVPVPPPRLSPSGAGTFVQCPRRWRFRYIDRLQDPPGEDALAGSFAHRVLELLMQREPSQRTVAQARVIARSEWPETEAAEDYQALRHDEEQSRRFRWKAWTAVEGLWHLEDPAKVEVQATEQGVEAELAGVPFRGIVDRIETEVDGIVVTDYKSGKAPPYRYRRSRLDQVLLYAAAVEASTGEMPVRARLLYLGQRTIGMDVNHEEIDAVTEKLAGTWSEIRTACSEDEFEPRTGPLCGWCPYVSMCPQGAAEVAAAAERKAAEEARLVALAS
ncbi:MAG: PD-(D/E)XK nuclease family protein [Acidimicrobiaceae bacterium]|nr:PD-(D/E)XK nuclease family protein [Acidimicrobiaceae bacterium]